MTDLMTERAALTRAIYDCDPDAFPGARAARRESELLAQLKAFDAAHPDVIAAIHAERVALNSDSIDRALRGED